MSMFGKQQRNGSRRNPTETAQLTENTVVHLWRSEDGRINWRLFRVNPNDDSKPYTTFRPQHLPELVKAHAVLAFVFSNAPELPADEQSALAELSKLLESVAEMVKASDLPQKENGKDESSRVLNFPQR